MLQAAAVVNWDFTEQAAPVGACARETANNYAKMRIDAARGRAAGIADKK